VLVVVISAVGQDTVGFLAWPAGLTGDGPLAKVFDQRQQLGDIVAIAAGQADRERDAAGVDMEMMLRASAATIYRGWRRQVASGSTTAAS